MSISLAQCDSYLQDRLVNTIDSPLTQTQRVKGMNQIIQFMQSKSHWDFTQRIKGWEYLDFDESDYSLENDLGLDDVKDIREIRDPNKSYERFSEIDNSLMDRYIRESRIVNSFTVEKRDNDKVLRMIYRNATAKKQLSAFNSLTSEGTWSSDTTNSDATTLTVDTQRKKEGSASLKFNIDVSQSTNNYAKISNETLTAEDLTDYENIGTFRMWLDFQQATEAQLETITNIELRVGDDTSNYWAMTVARPINVGSFKNQWNKISWAWRDATQTGTPTIAVTGQYIEIRINYSSGMTDISNVRVDDLNVFQPTEMEIVYFSDNMVNDEDDGLQKEFSIDTIDNTQTLLLPTRHRDGFLHLVTELLFRQMKDSDESVSWQIEELAGTEAFKAMKNDVGIQIVRNVATLEPRGSSTERVGRNFHQWS